MPLFPDLRSLASLLARLGHQRQPWETPNHRDRLGRQPAARRPLCGLLVLFPRGARRKVRSDGVELHFEEVGDKKDEERKKEKR